MHSSTGDPDEVGLHEIRILGILMVVSALGYLADSFAKFLVPQSADTLAVVVVVTALIGELPLTLWLLVKGVNVERWRQRALASPTPETMHAH